MNLINGTVDALVSDTAFYISEMINHWGEQVIVQNAGDLVSSDTVCCIGGKVKL